MVTETALLKLMDNIHGVLQQHENGISEYDLLQAVADDDVFNTLEDAGNLALYQKHFVIRHCLYRLQHQITEQQIATLSIEPIKISLIPLAECLDDQSLSAATNSSLRDYYLDWENFQSSETEVNDLLDKFWRDYAAYIQKDEAWEILQLEVGASLAEVTKRYRELAILHHPDKGGDREQFIKIRAAYESLKSVLQ